jgi:hypothetical protein
MRSDPNLPQRSDEMMMTGTGVAAILPVRGSLAHAADAVAMIERLVEGSLQSSVGRRVVNALAYEVAEMELAEVGDEVAMVAMVVVATGTGAPDSAVVQSRALCSHLAGQLARKQVLAAQRTGFRSDPVRTAFHDHSGKQSVHTAHPQSPIRTGARTHARHGCHHTPYRPESG